MVYMVSLPNLNVAYKEVIIFMEVQSFFGELLLNKH